MRGVVGEQGGRQSYTQREGLGIGTYCSWVSSKEEYVTRQLRNQAAIAAESKADHLAGRSASRKRGAAPQEVHTWAGNEMIAQVSGGGETEASTLARTRRPRPTTLEPTAGGAVCRRGRGRVRRMGGVVSLEGGEARRGAVGVVQGV
eukprot:6204040-Pleurochrysis_carterae.AAC.2